MNCRIDWARGRAPVLPGNNFTPASGYALVSLASGATLRAAAGSVLLTVGGAQPRDPCLAGSRCAVTDLRNEQYEQGGKPMKSVEFTHPQPREGRLGVEGITQGARLSWFARTDAGSAVSRDGDAPSPQEAGTFS